jgi:hypothetical protein
MMDRGGRKGGLTRPATCSLFQAHFAQPLKGSRFMPVSATQNVLIAEPKQVPSSLSAQPLPDDGLPPPNKAQVRYWRALVGVLSVAGSVGIADENGWPSAG